MNYEEIKNTAKQTIRQEFEAIRDLIDFVDDDFAKSVELIYNSLGRVIITGIGKSANIAQKIVATLNSTGTPAIFMHAADAIHGDMGNIQKDDVIICISKSGNTPEIKVLVPLIRNFGNPIIAIVGNKESYLAKQADLVIDTSVSREACPNNLAPTSSTTAQLVMGDALAVCLLEARGFSTEDFAKYHPGGILGKMLYLKVGDLCVNNEKPMVSPEDNIQQIIMEISSKRLGATAVIDQQHIVGIITDGDLRRMIQKNTDFNTSKAKDIMGSKPKTIEYDTLAINALQLMRQNNITQLLVTKDGIYFGVIHIHDLLKEGII